MVSFGPLHFFQSSPAHRTFPCGFDGELGCYVFLKTSMCKSFSVLCDLLLRRHNDVTIFTYKLTTNYCSFLSQVDSVYQKLS